MTFKEAITGAIPCMTDRYIREEFEIAVVDQRRSIYKIGKMDGDNFVWMGLPYTALNALPVYDWSHTDRTLLIIL